MRIVKARCSKSHFQQKTDLLHGEPEWGALNHLVIFRDDGKD